MLAEAGYRTHSAGKLHLTPWVTGLATPDPARYPEDYSAWQSGALRSLPTPYFGFQTVDFVGGHVSWAYGDYLRWLSDRGGDLALLKLPSASEVYSRRLNCWANAIPEELHYNRFIADSTIGLIERSAASGSQPFFAWCSFPDPHVPHAPPRPYCEHYDPADLPAPHGREGELDDLPPFYRRVLAGELRPNGLDNTGIGEDDWRRMHALDLGMIEHVDAEVGRVLSALDRSGLAGDTLVIFTTDHGDMMGDHGLLWKAFYTFRGCIQVPLIAAGPGVPRGIAHDGLVSHIDLLPTVLDLCGVPMPDSDWASRSTNFTRGSVQPLTPYPGRSWAPLVRGEADAGRRSVVIENDDPTTGLRPRCLVTPTHRLTVYPGLADGELFDLSADPWELRNLWYDPVHAALRAELTAELLSEYSRQTPLTPIPIGNA